MKKPDITPGPWKTFEPSYADNIAGNKGQVLAITDRQEKNWKANFRAIAALPDLLDALERILFLGKAEGFGEWEEWEEVKDAKAALIKAGYTFD